MHFKNNLQIFKLPNFISSPYTSSNLYEYLALPFGKNKIPPESNFPQRLPNTLIISEGQRYTTAKNVRNCQNQVEKH